MSKTKRTVTVSYRRDEVSTFCLDDLTKKEKAFVLASLKDDDKRSMDDWELLDEYDWRDILAHVFNGNKYDFEMDCIVDTNF